MNDTMAELAVRAARAEMERDQALEREQAAIENARKAWEATNALYRSDPQKMLETLHIIGIPARDLKDIYEIEQEWRDAGGCDEWLEMWRREHAGAA